MRRIQRGDGSGCIRVSDCTARDAGDDSVLYIIPGDSVAPCSREWIEESNYGRSITPQCYYLGNMGTAAWGEGWAATQVAAIETGSRKNADAEIYRYVYIPPPQKRQSSLRELGVYFVR